MKANKATVTVSALLVIVVLAMLLTCPGRKSHREAIYKAVNIELAEKGGILPESMAVDTILAANESFFDYIINPELTVLGYGLFSIGYIGRGENRQKVSFGILSNVFILEEENIANKIPMLKEPMPITPKDSMTK